MGKSMNRTLTMDDLSYYFPLYFLKWGYPNPLYFKGTFNDEPHPAIGYHDFSDTPMTSLPLQAVGQHQMDL